MKTNLSWQWSIYGKHPIAPDFFKLGEETPLFKLFSDWMEKGYQMYLQKGAPTRNLYSWRFWARGSQKEHLVCGVIKDSSDRLGRCFPLLILGAGVLPGWEEHWELLPLACENAWSQIEYFSTFSGSDLKKLGEELRHLRIPHSEWGELAKRGRDLTDHWMNSNHLNFDLKEMEENVLRTSDQNRVFLRLITRSSIDQWAQVGFYHLLIKKKINRIPNAIFMGGSGETLFISLFRRPLQVTDFVQLWTISTQEDLSSIRD